MTRRRYEDELLVCPKHPHEELQKAGGEHHAPGIGWCKKCKSVVKGVPEPEPR